MTSTLVREHSKAFDLGVNLADPDSFARGFPHDLFRTLRREAPVYWHKDRHEQSKKEGFFVVSKYEDVRQVGRTPEALPTASPRW